MGIKNTVFFLDLKTLRQRTDEDLKKFAIQEELDESDLVNIIINEAKRIGEEDEVKVTFKIVDGNDDSFRVIVEPAGAKYVGTIIYPFTKIASRDFEFVLDSVCGRISLYNMKDKYKKMSVSIDGIGLDLFSMSYLKAKELLINNSDRKQSNGYIEYPDSICFKQYGIKLNAKKEENGDIKPDSLLASIDIYNNEEFFKDYYFEKEKPQKEIKEEVKREENNTSDIDKVKETLKKELEFELNKNVEMTSDIDVKKVNDNQSEIKELEKLLEEEKRQQDVLEKRIEAKLNELRNQVNTTQKEKSIDFKEDIEIDIPEKTKEYTQYVIESYEGIKEKGKEELFIYFGQSKVDIRRLFGGAPKELREYEEMEIYDVFYAYYDDMDKCTGIGIYNEEGYKDKIALYFLKRNLITMPYKDIVKLIKKYDYDAIEDEDGIISLKYGISVDPKESSNYDDEICDVIHIFKKGYYDEVY